MRTIQLECIVFRKKNTDFEFLLLKRIPTKGGFWQPVCGGMEEKDKSILDAAFRELKEEANIGQKDILNIFPNIHNFEINRHYLTGQTIQTITEHVFGFEIDSNFFININKNIYPEHEEIKWASFKDALNLLKWEDNKNGLKKLYEILSNKKVR